VGRGFWRVGRGSTCWQYCFRLATELAVRPLLWIGSVNCFTFVYLRLFWSWFPRHLL
jgi:hypothetical protein